MPFLQTAEDKIPQFNSTSSWVASSPNSAKNLAMDYVLRTLAEIMNNDIL